MRALLPLLLLAAAPAAAQQALPDLLGPRAIGTLPAAAPSETLHYGDAPAQTVELFAPRTPPPEHGFPVAVLIHGGCWRHGGGGPEMMRPAAGALVERGFAVWSIDYRAIGDTGGGYPGTYQDIGRAVDLVAEQAAARHLDPARVVLVGHSAGGHLAMWAAGRAKIPASSPLAAEKPMRPRGVVTAGGFGSLERWGAHINSVCGAGTLAAITAPAEGDARFADTSPDRLLPTGVPLVMVHGIYDPAAFPAVGLEQVRAARKSGDRAEIELAPNAGHHEPIAPGTRAFEQLRAAIERLAGGALPGGTRGDR